MRALLLAVSRQRGQLGARGLRGRPGSDRRHGFSCTANCSAFACSDQQSNGPAAHEASGGESRALRAGGGSKANAVV